MYADLIHLFFYPFITSTLSCKVLLSNNMAAKWNKCHFAQVWVYTWNLQTTVPSNHLLATFPTQLLDLFSRKHFFKQFDWWFVLLLLLLQFLGFYSLFTIIVIVCMWVLKIIFLSPSPAGPPGFTPAWPPKKKSAALCLLNNPLLHLWPLFTVQSPQCAQVIFYDAAQRVEKKNVRELYGRRTSTNVVLHAYKPKTWGGGIKVSFFIWGD